jgi:hypothetical protein
MKTVRFYTASSIIGSSWGNRLNFQLNGNFRPNQDIQNVFGLKTAYKTISAEERPN